MTLAEVDSLRTSVEAAVEVFRESVLPALEEQDGYEGCYVLVTDEGKALVMTFWTSADAADAGLASGFYAEQVAKFVTFYRASPGREAYGVRIADAPCVAA